VADKYSETLQIESLNGVLANISDIMTSLLFLLIEDIALKQTECDIIYRTIPLA
jgi:hypothetical protein